MSIFSRVLMVALAGGLIASCGSNPHYSGKGDDHQVVYRGYPDSRDDDRRVVYVERPAQTYVYYEPVPAYRVVPVQPTYRVVPVTRYYYVD